MGVSEADSSSTSLDQIESIFRRIDKNHDGKISPAELRNCMLLAGEDMTEEEADAAVELVDSDGDGLLGLEDFLKLARGGGDADGDGGEEKGSSLKRAFGVYEMKGEGCITARSLMAALGRLGERRTVEECEGMIRRFDINGDGVLSYDEFRVMMML